MALGCDEGCRLGKDGFKAFHGAEGHDFGLGVVGARGEDFGPVGEHVDVRRRRGVDICHENGARDFAEKRRLFVIRFDQGQVDVRRPDFQREGGESGAGANVDNAERVRRGGENSPRRFG